MYKDKIKENSMENTFRYDEKFCNKYPTWKIVFYMENKEILHNINKIQYGFISDKGKFYKRVNKIPQNDNYIMVAKTI
ncbi:hypothetical protein EXQ37_03835 [Clostridium botulinum]|nr:hypothetical protein [Clostridium botulinum]MBO0558976.1 hypothetical protein [Clostridium botulinum]